MEILIVLSVLAWSRKCEDCLDIRPNLGLLINWADFLECHIYSTDIHSESEKQNKRKRTKYRNIESEDAYFVCAFKADS